MEEQDLRDQFEAELNRMKENSVLSPAYRRRKMITWVIRTALAVAIYYFLWEYKWVRWTLLIYVPLNLFGLLSIVGWTYLLNKKVDQTRQHIDEADQMTEDIEYEELD